MESEIVQWIKLEASSVLVGPLFTDTEPACTWEFYYVFFMGYLMLLSYGGQKLFLSD